MNKERKVIVSMRLSPEIIKAVKAQALAEGRSFASWIERLLRIELIPSEKKPKHIE